MSIERLVEASRALERGDLVGAERIYRAVTAVDPRSTIALVGLARVALARGGEADLVEVERLANAVLVLDVENPAARRLLDEWRARTAPTPPPVTPEQGPVVEDGDRPAAAAAAAAPADAAASAVAVASPPDDEGDYPWPDLDEQLARYRPGGPSLVDRLLRRDKG